MGGSVESMIRQVKAILYSSIGKKMLDLQQFQLVVAEANALVNKRPLAFKEALSSNKLDDLDQLIITPELLLRGYEVPSLNVLPITAFDEQNDPSYELKTNVSSSDLFAYFKDFSATRNNLYVNYEKEFLRTLEKQSTDKKARYKHSNQPVIKVGDLVAIKTKLLKPFSYPKALVHSIEFNNLGEINALSLRKANKEIVRRHPSDVILLQTFDSQTDSNDSVRESDDSVIAPENTGNESRPLRKAKLECERANKRLCDSGLI